jgi:hypothetical protein
MISSASRRRLARGARRWTVACSSFVGLTAIAFFFGPMTELVAKAYAIIGTLCAALPFFEEAELKRDIVTLRSELEDTSRDDERTAKSLHQRIRTLETEIDQRQTKSHALMRAALVLAASSFMIEALLLASKLVG